MKQQQLHKLLQAFKTGFLSGGIASLVVYGTVRMLFYEFSFTAKEELVNSLIIVFSGGLIVSVSMIVFLVLEMALQGLSGDTNYFSFSKAESKIDDIEDYNYPLAEMNRTA